MIRVGGADREIATFEAGLIPKVRLFETSGVPRPFDRINPIHSGVLILFIAHFVKNKELRLRANIAFICDARFFQVSSTLSGNVARVTGVILFGDRVNNVGYYADGWFCKERVNNRSIRVGHSQHIGYMNPLPAAN